MTDWSQYRRYRCRHCQAECINRLDHATTITQQCRSCYAIPDLDTARRIEQADDLVDPVDRRALDD